ncbi:hypothetical protein AURDEDRAFT_172231 [Auricularia subglabra TFB-10046 SS5]|nr:hypothetical protein AURDEDRAFT_172231 [Auricularia subglabra TFB-10046 SS5]
MAEGTLAQAIEVYQQFQLTRYTAVSAWAWLIYDMVLMFPLEVKHIWRRDFSLPQALYCFIRYYALAYISYLCIITLVLVVLLIGQTTLGLVITGQAALSAHALPTPPELRRWPGCFSEKLDRSPRFTSSAWAVALAVDSLFFGMTLYKLWKLRVSGVRVSGIITVFARDGAMFFGMIFGEHQILFMMHEALKGSQLEPLNLQTR